MLYKKCLESSYLSMYILIITCLLYPLICHDYISTRSQLLSVKTNYNKTELFCPYRLVNA